MSSAAVPVPRLLTAPPTRSVVPVLARQEARRLMLHPLTLLGFAVFAFNAVLSVVVDQGPRSAFETVNMVLTFYPGMLLVLSANLVATRDLRAGTGEVLGPLPAREEERVTALALASLAPALVGAVLVVVLHGAYLLLDRYVEAPGVWHIVSGPVTLLGASLFGLMLAVWAPARTVGLVGVVALIAVNVYLDGESGERLFGAAVSWARWGLYADDWAGTYDGSPGWHVGYLVALCLMAFAAAWVRVANRRTPAVALGLAALAAAVLTGIAQLP